MADDYLDLERFARTHECPTCGRDNRLIRRIAGGVDQVYCRACGRTEGFVKIKSLRQMWREDPGSVPIQIANRLADRHREGIEAVAQGLPPDLAATVRERYGLPGKKE